MNAAALLWSRRGLVFDLDGTLVDTLPDLTASLNHALRELGLETVTPALVSRSLHGGLEGSAVAALATQDVPGGADRALPALLSLYGKRYAAACAQLSRPYPGVREVLAQLQHDGVPMSVCTNKTEAQALQLLGALDLLHRFDGVVGADTCGRRKPHPEPLQRALALLGVPAAQALLVGDSEVDRDCAQAAGIALLAFEGGYGEWAPQVQPRFADWTALLAARARPG